MLSSSQAYRLLSNLCIRWGWCIPPDAAQKLVDFPPGTAHEFTDAIVIAEGLDPATTDRHSYRKLYTIVNAAYQHALEETGY
jgi:hypothetical protein